jgi:hypothetical protein
MPRSNLNIGNRAERLRPAAGPVALWLVTAVAVGDTIHYLSHRLGVSITHHSFHLLFTVGALSVFTFCVIANVRRNGWPKFSWHL